MVVLATKSVESPALQSEFPAQVLFSESFCSEKFLGDPEAHVQIRSRKGKRKVKDRVLNIREHEIWTRGDLEAQSSVWWAVSSLPAGIQRVSDPVSRPQICSVHSGCSPSLLGTPQVLAQEMKQERLAGQSCPFILTLQCGGQSRSPPHSLLVPPALQCRPSLSFSNDHCGVMLW